MLNFYSCRMRCDITSSIEGVGKVTAFKKLLSNNNLQEAALVFATSSKLHEQMSISIIFMGNTDQSFNSLHHKQLI